MESVHEVVQRRRPFHRQSCRSDHADYAADPEGPRIAHSAQPLGTDMRACTSTSRSPSRSSVGREDSERVRPNICTSRGFQHLQHPSTTRTVWPVSTGLLHGWVKSGSLHRRCHLADHRCSCPTGAGRPVAGRAAGPAGSIWGAIPVSGVLAFALSAVCFTGARWGLGVGERDKSTRIDRLQLSSRLLWIRDYARTCRALWVGWQLRTRSHTGWFCCGQGDGRVVQA